MNIPLKVIPEGGLWQVIDSKGFLICEKLYEESCDHVVACVNFFDDSSTEVVNRLGKLSTISRTLIEENTRLTEALEKIRIESSSDNVGVSIVVFKRINNIATEALGGAS